MHRNVALEPKESENNSAAIKAEALKEASRQAKALWE
jgi:hypothetical protein